MYEIFSFPNGIGIKVPNGMKVKVKVFDWEEIGECYTDEDGNLEVFIPKTQLHSEFYITPPNMFNIEYNMSDNIPTLSFY